MFAPSLGRMLLAATMGAVCLGIAAAETAKPSKPFEVTHDDDGTKVFVVHGKQESFDVDLLPPAPKSLPRIISTTDLSLVTEVSLEEALARNLSKAEAMSQIEFRFALVNTLNRKRTDGFLRELIARRPDLAGLPLRMGAECRMSEEQAEAFGTAVAEVRSERKAVHVASTAPSVAAAMQIFGPREEHHEMVGPISRVSDAAATVALVRLVLFSPDAKARESATAALKVRREQDYTEPLVAGLRYPLPIVARRAAEAVVRLQRQDLLPKMIEVLESGDPRLPEGSKARELVRINHHRNCLLCHPPHETKMTIRVADPRSLERIEKTLKSADRMKRAESDQALHVPVPLPSVPFESGADRYGRSSDDEHIQIRADATYLRQDFSAMLPVEDAAPWPMSQRFDFVVRTWTVTEAEAKDLADKLRPHGEGEISPYHRAALFALRELTGLEATSPSEWRRLLKLPR
jgi:hypothetical protein